MASDDEGFGQHWKRTIEGRNSGRFPLSSECVRALYDVIDLAPDVLRHRLVLSYEALADGLTPDQLVYKIMQRIAPPEKPLETHVRFASQA